MYLFIYLSFFASLKVRNEFYKDTQGAMLVYDVSNRESFEALDSWLEEIKRDIGSQADFEGVTFAVCANKVRHLKTELFYSFLPGIDCKSFHHLFYPSILSK